MGVCILGKTLMIVGAGVEQVPAYEAAKRRGLTIVGTDANENAPGLALADHVLIVSTRDAEGTVAKALEFRRDHAVDGVMTIANDVPYTVARIADALGLVSISLDAAKCATNKLLMKQRFHASKVACPWFAGVEGIGELKELLAKVDDEAYVLKPVDGRGARGVLLLDGNVDLEWAYEESRRWGESGQLILEKFIPGIQLSTESFILEGKCYTPAIAERNYRRLEQFRPNIIEDGGTIPSTLESRQIEAIDDIILRGAAAMGIEAGLIKGDLVIDDSGTPLIIELAPRLSGGWLATHQIPAASGVSLVDAVISYSLGELITAEQLMPRYHRSTAIRYWFPPAGVIHEIRGEEDLKKIPGLLQYGFFRKKGERQPPIRMHPDRFGYVIVEGVDRAEAIARVDQALACVTVEVA